jgi:hypothetical protein
MTANEINDKIVELYQTKPSNCTGILYSRKIVDGIMTDEWGFTYIVNEKKPIENLNSEDLVPKTINLESTEIRTDVIQGENKFTAFQDCPCDFYYWTPTFCSTQTRPQPQTGRNVPLVGGIRITNPIFNTPTSNIVGTLGFIAVDNNDGSIVGVTNNHVIIQDAFRADEWNPSGVLRSSNNQVVVQPTDNPYTGTKVVGAVKRYVPMLKQATGLNYVDGALLTVDPAYFSSDESYKQFGFTGFTYPLPFATTSEIDNLIFNNWNFYSVGQTTGVKGEGASKLFFNGYATITLDNDLQNTASASTFSNVISYIASASTITPGNLCLDPIYGGDSGSALVANINGTYKIIGLCFAGFYGIYPGVGGVGNYIRYRYGYACRIDKVAEELEISAYTGQTVNFSDRNNREVVYVSGQSSQNSITQGGKKYWQVGLSNN